MNYWIIPVTLSSIAAIMYAALAIKKYKDTDKVWDTVVKLCQDNTYCDPKKFIDMYRILKMFKDTGCTMGFNEIDNTLHIYKQDM